MTDIVLAAGDLAAVQRKLIGGPVESCAVLYAGSHSPRVGHVRLVVREVEFPTESDYQRRGPLEAQLRPDFVARVAKRSRQTGESVVFVHSHPGDAPPQFSPIDGEGEQHLVEFFERRQPGSVHASLVVSAGGLCARRLGSGESARVVSLGESIEYVSDSTTPDHIAKDQFDRQIKAFGEAGQRALGRLRFGILGLGGIGSLVAQQLVHLGVRRFVLIDPDTLERTNLNRVANATPADIGTSKVEVAKRYMMRVAPDAEIVTIEGDATRVSVSQKLTAADFLFGCTDSHGSRAVLQQVSYQYLIPCIDTGMTIAVDEGRVDRIVGRSQLLAPGLPCLTCTGLLNPAEVRRDMMSEFERKEDPYLQGAREPAPAVMSLNGTVASLAVTMLLSVLCGVPSDGRSTKNSTTNASR